APHEWVDNVELLARLGPQMGLVVEVLPELDLDAPDLDPWAARIDDDVVAISLPHVTSVAGLRYPLEAIAALPRPENCRLLVDGAQGIGQVPLALEGSGVDLYTGTCRKWLRGPKQTAVIWCSEALGMAPQALRPNDTHVGVRLGLARAVEMAADYPAELAPLSEHVRTKAAALGLPCLSTPASGTTAITIEVPLAAKDRAAAALTAEGILIKWPDAAADEPHSHLATEPRAMIRIAPHVANQAHEIDRLFEVIGRHL
ncbi:MAG: aminotransferase class V-fold PLP-dependent enzyme, partial [Pseudomonadota bacterium]